VVLCEAPVVVREQAPGQFEVEVWQGLTDGRFFVNGVFGGYGGTPLMPVYGTLLLDHV
jgi:hypothetical protein